MGGFLWYSLPQFFLHLSGLPYFKKEKQMKCWHCNKELIWGGDHDYEDYGLEGEGIVSNFSCRKCDATYECYLPLGGQDD
tara:strand:- start:2432 stop:2671 length:240 start_codon:yes stop_codon:yes gene_type:complete